MVDQKVNETKQLDYSFWSTNSKKILKIIVFEYPVDVLSLEFEFKTWNWSRQEKELFL